MKLGLNFEAYNIANNWSPTSLASQAYTETKGVLTYTPTAFVSAPPTADSPTARRHAACR